MEHSGGSEREKGERMNKKWNVECSGGSGMEKGEEGKKKEKREEYVCGGEKMREKKLLSQ